MACFAGRHLVRIGAGALLLAVLAGCASVDLSGRYDPPPILTPQNAPPPPPPPPPVAQSQPVSPVQPVPQPLPPVGAALPGQPSALPADPADPNATLVTFNTRMDGASAMPPSRSGGTGQIDALYDTRSRLLRWKASWSGLSAPITAVQFHGPAELGQNGPPTMIWPGPFGPTYEGRATLTTQQATDLLSGRWYVNVFTASFPSGEIRGQMREVR